MAGSKDRFVYRSDILDDSDERKYLVLTLDESNAEAMEGVHYTASAVSGLEAVDASDAIRVEPRYVLFEGKTAAGKIVRRKLVAPNPDADYWVEGGNLSMYVSTGITTGETVVFSVTGMVGEKRTVAPDTATDSGLDDLDQE